MCEHSKPSKFYLTKLWIWFFTTLKYTLTCALRTIWTPCCSIYLFISPKNSMTSSAVASHGKPLSFTQFLSEPLLAAITLLADLVSGLRKANWSNCSGLPDLFNTCMYVDIGICKWSSPIHKHTFIHSHVLSELAQKQHIAQHMYSHTNNNKKTLENSCNDCNCHNDLENLGTMA